MGIKRVFIDTIFNTFNFGAAVALLLMSIYERWMPIAKIVLTIDILLQIANIALLAFVVSMLQNAHDEAVSANAYVAITPFQQLGWVSQPNTPHCNNQAKTTA